ncbi:sensor domain-containing protein [Noviherbaspirillum sp.]|uniref:sensor domain-containing protein n=1 Tax=Noviherbaspirillum sp. TaxID=1926288 RepID=UPI002B465AD5|nr:diguanylate cyclase [Noviherbaspirillum sp.]HJV83056.1 diguanylate cyclase [Noviherbaspirillum sp.]
MDMKTPATLPDFADLLLDAVFMVDVRGHIVYVNAACECIFGYTPAEMIGKKLIDFVLPEDRVRTWEEAMLVMTGRPRVGFENRYVRKDGSIASIMWSARWSKDDQLRIGVARDVTDRKRAEALQAATYAISEAAHTAGDLVGLYREVHRIIAKLVPVTSFAVAMWDETTGRLSFPYQLDIQGDSALVQDPVARQLCADVIHGRQPVLAPEASPDALAGDAASQEEGESWLGVPLVTRKNTMGALIVKSHLGTFYTEKDKELLQYVSTQVVTAIERRQLHDELLRLAQYDDLTGLPNRRVFYDRMELALARKRRERGRAAVLYLDLNDFKQINDSLGHAAGDLMLQEVARRLKQCVREEDTVTRLGGDEFAVLLEKIQMPEDAEAIAEKVHTALGQPASIAGKLLRMVPSVGIALYPDHGNRVEELLKHADNAMYAAKKNTASARRKGHFPGASALSLPPAGETF